MVNEVMDYHRIYEVDFGIKKISLNGNQGLGCCPVHNDKNPSFTWSLETGQNHCFSCGWKGNTYLLAKELNMENPRQYLDSTNTYLNNSGIVRYEPNNTVKIDSVSAVVIEKETKYNELKKRYGSRSNLGDNYKNKYVGKSDIDEDVFIYPKGIKIHKKYWIKEASMDTSNQIFMENEMSSFDKSRVYLFEGEKDAIRSPLKGVSFSCGATSIPKNIDALYNFNEVVIVYDHDEAGEQGAKKVAKRIKIESPKTKVLIAQWDSSLPKGYDVYDDYETGFEKVDEAIFSAIQYEIPIPNQIEGFTIMTGKEASNTTPKPTEWIIENVLPKGFNCCLAGTTGSKKSMWAMQLAISIANGERDFCGNRIIGGSKKVLFIDTEIGKDELLRRYHRITKKVDWKGNENIIMMSKGGTTMDIWKQAEEVIQAWKPDIVIIDSMYNATTVSDFSKATGMTKVTDALAIIKHQYRVTILTIAHFNKGNDEQATHIDRMQGSAVFKNSIEFQMCMIQTNVDDFNIFQIQKTRGVPFDRSFIGLKWDDFWFTTKGVLEDIREYLITEPKKRKYISVLEELPDRFDTKDWLNVFNSKYEGMSERTGKAWLSEISRTQMVDKVAHGLYEKKLKLIEGDEIN